MLSEEVKRMESEINKLQENNRLLIERLKEEGKELPKNCESCENFIRHYYRCGKNDFFPLGCGHCRNLRYVRGMKDEHDCCKYYQPIKY